MGKNHFKLKALEEMKKHAQRKATTDPSAIEFLFARTERSIEVRRACYCYYYMLPQLWISDFSYILGDFWYFEAHFDTLFNITCHFPYSNYFLYDNSDLSS